MAEERIFISKHEEREFIDMLDENKVLNFHDIQNIDKYLIFAALGNDDPKEIQSKEGYVRVDAERSTEIKAKLSCFLLGAKVDDDSLDENADFKKCIEYADKCAYSGYLKFRKLFYETQDEDALLKKLELQLDLLYSEYFD